MSSEILDLERWIERMLVDIRHACREKQAPCVAFCLLFFDMMAKPEEMWNYSIHLVEDEKNNPMSWPKEERERVYKSFEFIMEGARRIMAGEFDDLETLH